MKDNNNISQELLECVERFYSNTMSAQERLEFESKLDNDKEFKTRVDVIKTLILGIENQSLKEQLDVFHETITDAPSKTATASGYFTIRKLAAAVVIFLAISSFWWFSSSSNDKLYGDYFTPDPGLPTVMSTASNFKFYDAMVNYKMGDYKKAIEKWESISTKNDTLNYFLGVAFLADDNQINAISYLEKVTKDKEFPLLPDTYHYLGLAYLKIGKLEKAKLNLEQSTLSSSNDLLLELKD